MSPANAVPLCRNYNDVVYRYHNPQWAFDPISGKGAARKGGRFNRPGQDTLYTSIDVTTAFYEAAQGMIVKPHPMTLCSYETDLTQILDLTSTSNKSALGIMDSQLGCAWRRDLADGKVPASWSIADDLISQGVIGILVKSFAPLIPQDGVNLVLWDWSETGSNKVTVVDPNKNLPKDRTSWE